MQFPFFWCLLLTCTSEPCIKLTKPPWSCHRCWTPRRPRQEQRLAILGELRIRKRDGDHHIFTSSMESQRTSENKIAPQEQWMSISWFDHSVWNLRTDMTHGCIWKWCIPTYGCSTREKDKLSDFCGSLYSDKSKYTFRQIQILDILKCSTMPPKSDTMINAPQPRIRLSKFIWVDWKEITCR